MSSHEINLLAEQYHDLIFKYMRIHHLEEMEFYDVLAFPFIKSIEKYFGQPERYKCSFKAFLFGTFDWKMKSYWRKQYRRKKTASFVSLEGMSDNARLNLLAQASDPLDILCEQDTALELLSLLHPRQRRTMQMRLQGLTFSGIAQETGQTRYRIASDMEEMRVILDKFQERRVAA